MDDGSEYSSASAGVSAGVGDGSGGGGAGAGEVGTGGAETGGAGMGRCDGPGTEPPLVAVVAGGEDCGSAAGEDDDGGCVTGSDLVLLSGVAGPHADSAAVRAAVVIHSDAFRRRELPVTFFAATSFGLSGRLPW